MGTRLSLIHIFSAFFGMATAFMEATLAQIFKERKGDELVGGLPFYGKKIMGNRAWVGVLLSCIFISYAMFCLPAQVFNVFSSVGSVAEIVTCLLYTSQQNRGILFRLLIQPCQQLTFADGEIGLLCGQKQTCQFLYLLLVIYHIHPIHLHFCTSMHLSLIHI